MVKWLRVLDFNAVIRVQILLSGHKLDLFWVKVPGSNPCKSAVTKLFRTSNSCK